MVIRVGGDLLDFELLDSEDDDDDGNEYDCFVFVEGCVCIVWIDFF